MSWFGEAGALWNRFQPSSKIFLLTVPRRSFFCGSFMVFLSCFCYAVVRVCLLMPCGQLTSWLLFVMSKCEVVTFPLVSWIRCGTWLYQFLIFAPLLTLRLLFRLITCDFWLVTLDYFGANQTQWWMVNSQVSEFAPVLYCMKKNFKNVLI